MMKKTGYRNIFVRVQVLLSALLLSVSSFAADYAYQADANPQTALTQALAKSKSNNKLVLVVFGSDWCPDCRSLNKKMSEAPLNKTIKQHFTVMHVDIGNWDKNMKFTEKFGKPVSNGIPSIAILDNEQNIKYVSLGGDLATARSSKTTSLNTWFEKVIADIKK